MLNLEDQHLEHRRRKLKELLNREEDQYIQELVTKQELEECKVCKERENKINKYHENIEQEKIRECQKALEREKM